MSVDRQLADLLNRSPRVDRKVLGEALQVLRRASGLPVQDFARKAELSPTLLGQVESGKDVPNQDVLMGYLQAAGIEPPARRVVRSIWEQARKEDTGRHTGPARDAADPRRRRPPGDRQRRRVLSVADPAMWPLPEEVTTARDFTATMEKIKKSTGMSYRELHEASRKRGFPVSRTSLHNLCTKPKPLKAPDPVVCLLLVAGATPALVERWLKTWQRLSMESGEEAPTPTCPTDATAGAAGAEDEVAEIPNPTPAPGSGVGDAARVPPAHQGAAKETRSLTPLLVGVIALLCVALALTW
ncbi:helix-turn-helix domain-containing protein [Actinosynnema sp. NPDC059797]